MKRKTNINIIILFTLLFSGVYNISSGQTKISFTQEEVLKFKAKGYVTYNDLGAKGDGKTNDIYAIAATHTFANQNKLKVKANDGATYYIGAEGPTAIIQTDTDFGTAKFIIDDTNVSSQNASLSVFMISSSLKSFKLKGIFNLKRNQEKIDITLPSTCIITAINSNVYQYIRFGGNQNNGKPQTDIFIADKKGYLDKNSPIIWDFEQITDINALPIDTVKLSVTGGQFLTIANNAKSEEKYYARGIAVRRSNVELNGIEHRITGEGGQGAPYGGFINIGDCAYITVRNTVLTGHKVYQIIGSAGVTVSKGTYDISISRALNVSFINCKQTNDINDSKYWGILVSNYCKNLLYDSCTFSRFDAHMGVANATIRNSTLGHQGINAIGSGTFLVENSTIYSKNLINLRSDYGSTWQGEFIIRNCNFIPANGKLASFNLIGGSYTGLHNFGYTCYMPEKITIDNLRIDDSKYPNDHKGGSVFDNFNTKMINDSYVEKFPYEITKEVILKNVTTTSGKELKVSNNLYMFKDVKIKYLNGKN
jgi:hypothetical protein